ncbi:MAG: hypothetical protein JWO36_4392 [Myxococcales bacterium]|nr:hypothetical protein [Myxococcales bacterium]
MLFGLDDLQPVADAPVAPDVPPHFMVSGRYGWFVLAPTGGTVVGTEQITRPSSLRAILDSGLEPTITFDSSDNFSFPLEHEGQSYRLIYRGTVGDLATEIQDNAIAVAIVFPIYGRTDRVPVTSKTDLQFTVTNGPSGGTTLITSTGLRTRSLGGSPVPMFTFDWRAAGVVSGTNGLLDSAKGDVLYYAHYMDNTTEHCFVVDAIGSANVTLATGVPTAVAVTPQSVPAPHCVSFVPRRAEELARLQNVWPPRMGDAVTTAWQILSVPTPDATSQGGIPVVFNNDVGSSGERHAVRFGNPYTSESMIIFVTTEIDRKIAVPGTTVAASIAYSTSHWFAVTDNCSGAPIDMAGTVGIPSNPTLGGQTIVENSVVNFDRNGLVALDFVTASPGAIDYHEVSLFEFDGVGTTTVAKTIYRWRVFGSRVMVDPSLMVKGTNYAFQVMAMSGYPKIAERDFKTASYPAGTSTVFTPVFKAP